MTAMTIAGQAFDLDPGQVEPALRDELPETIVEHFVVGVSRRWPPKQDLAAVTGLDRADFTTHQARRPLTRLGFTAGRSGWHKPRGQGAGASEGEPPGAAPVAEALRPFIGQWVAVRGDEVLVAADSPKDVVAWLARHQQQAQSVFRVPESDEVADGAGPQ